MTIPAGLDVIVRRRALERCEYCWMHQSLQGATFHIEHIVPRSRGGDTIERNLALACPGCNLHKSNCVEVMDSSTGETVRLFNPRIDAWDEHFGIKGFHIVGKSSIAAVTIIRLQMNHERRIKIRQAEEGFDLFPP